MYHYMILPFLAWWEGVGGGGSSDPTFWSGLYGYRTRRPGSGVLK